MSWDDPGSYDLVINTDVLGTEVVYNMVEGAIEVFNHKDYTEKLVKRLKELYLAQKIVIYLLYEEKIPVHFLEVDVVDKVFDERAAKAFGLKEGCITITVHCGSRGCGHQIATDYLQLMERYVRDNHVDLPDRQLACAPLDTKLGDEYYRAMSCGANYA